jgi:hypothetical protein
MVLGRNSPRARSGKTKISAHADIYCTGQQNIHISSGIQTLDLSIQAARDCTSHSNRLHTSSAQSAQNSKTLTLLILHSDTRSALLQNNKTAGLSLCLISVFGGEKTLLGCGTEFIWLRIGTCGEIFGHRMEPSSSIKCGEFLDWLGVQLVLKNDSATCTSWLVWLAG